MIARIWHGVTEVRVADEYVHYLMATGLPDYQAAQGNRGAYFLRRVEGNQAHFLALSFWESEQAIRGFAGDEIERARYYPEDARYLLEMEPLVKHYEILGDR